MVLSPNVHGESNLGKYQKTVQSINVECLNLICVAYDLWYKFGGMETQEDTSIRSAAVKKTNDHLKRITRQRRRSNILQNVDNSWQIVGRDR